MQNVRDFQFHVRAIKLSIFLVKTVISQVSINIVKVIAALVLLAGQADQSIMVQKDGHGIHDRRYEHINAEVKLVPFP